MCADTLLLPKNSSAGPLEKPIIAASLSMIYSEIFQIYTQQQKIPAILRMQWLPICCNVSKQTSKQNKIKIINLMKRVHLQYGTVEWHPITFEDPSCKLADPGVLSHSLENLYFTVIKLFIYFLNQISLYLFDKASFCVRIIHYNILDFFFFKSLLLVFPMQPLCFFPQQIKQNPLPFGQISLSDQTVSSLAGRNLHVTQIPSFLSFGCKVGKKWVLKPQCESE